MKKWLAAAAVLLVTIGAIVYVVAAPSDDQKIRKVLQRLARTVEPRENANPMFELGRIQDDFSELMTEHVEVSIPDVGSVPSARKELAKAAVAGGSRYGGGEITFDDLKIKIDDARLRADVDCTTTFKRTTTSAREERRVHFSLRNDDHWRVSSINVSGASR